MLDRHKKYNVPTYTIDETYLFLELMPPMVRDVGLAILGEVDLDTIYECEKGDGKPVYDTKDYLRTRDYIKGQLDLAMPDRHFRSPPPHQGPQTRGNLG